MADYIEDDDLVILGDREEAQMQAIRSNASCIIIGGGLEVAEEVKKLAEKRDCVIITTPFDTFSVARLINQSMPIKQYMTRRELVTFDIDDYVDDVKGCHVAGAPQRFPGARLKRQLRRNDFQT